MNEKYTPNVIKVNDSENAWLTEHGHLQMDGASYIKGMDDYEWYFATHKDYFPKIYKELSGNTEAQEDISNVLMKYLQENGTTISELMDVCRANELEYQFSNWM